MAHTDEKAFNALLAQALSQRHPRWEVNAEQSGVLRGQSGRTPDIVITPMGGRAGNPVVIETEYDPAASVVADAVSRLGSILDRSDHTIEQVIALRIPTRLAEVSPADLPDEIADAKFSYTLVSLPRSQTTVGITATNALDPIRFPEVGWIDGTVDDLAGFCERIALNEHLLDSAVSLLENTINSVASKLRDALEPNRKAVLEEIAGALHQADDLQTTRMGVAIVANALLFQSAIAGTSHPEYNYVIYGPRPDNSRFDIVSTWNKILEIDYKPIFSIARDVLNAIPDSEAKQAIRSLSEMSSELSRYGVTSTGDMAGQMFGKLITDRKFLATFYTLPASAHLLSEIAVSRLSVDWSDRECVSGLKVADLACGTGSLLTAAYQRVMARVRRSGGDDQKLHTEMMEKVLIGADIMPAAVHLTATLLSSTYPAVPFEGTRIFLMPYGRIGEVKEVGEEIGNVEIGSLELLTDSFNRPLNLFDVDRETIGREVITGQGNRQIDSVLSHECADLVIMNPPFTRATNRKTAAAAGVPVPSFAGLETEATEQRLMKARLRGLSRRHTDCVGNENAGLASYFVDIAHSKIKLGGVISFVLPFSVIQGDSWSDTRTLLASYYRDICIVTIATTGSTNQSFSADTGMSEALIVATRCLPNDNPTPHDVLYINLYDRPGNLVEAVEIARKISILSLSEKNPHTHTHTHTHTQQTDDQDRLMSAKL